MKLYEKDIALVQKYLVDNKDKSILEVYDSIRRKRLRERTKAEVLVFTYLYMNRKEFGIK